MLLTKIKLKNIFPLFSKLNNFQLAAKYGLHPNQISQWKNQFVRNASSVFSGPKALKKKIEADKA